MRKLTLLLTCLIAMSSATSYAQRSSRAARNEMTCPKLYMGVGLGMESPQGLVGFNIDVPITSSFSLGTGFGLSSWGSKAYAEARYYFGKCNRGWAIGTGATYNTGLKSFTTVLPTTSGDVNVPLTLNPKTNVFVAAYKFWNLGRSGHRFYLQLGYSFRLDENNYTVNGPYTLTSDGDQVMKILAPGGLMIGVGFSFGIIK